MANTERSREDPTQPLSPISSNLPHTSRRANRSLDPPSPSARPIEASTLTPHGTASELVRILDRYADDLRAGLPVDRNRIVAEHPELAEELAKALTSIEFIHHGALGRGTPDGRLGDFRIIRELGRGGMGVVYEAEQVSLKRRVALKVLSFGAVADEEAMQRFRREAETVATLHHTNIVPIFAIGSEGNVHYYAMQLIEGRSLAEVAQWQTAIFSGPDDAHASTPLVHTLHSALDIAQWGLQAAEALAHAHARSVVHRDVKPSNLILDNDGCIWLTDFGLAKRQQDVTLSVAGAIMGTPRYMSPEQAAALDKVVDHRTDVYSLGATLYELATGQPIFQADSPHQVLIQIIEKDPPRPRSVNPGIPRDLETIILKCLLKDPAERYSSSRELADDLRAFTENRPIKARQAGPIERTLRWAKKHRRPIGIAASSAAAAIAVILAALFGTEAYRQSRMGELKLTTRSSQLIAEVLNQDGETVRHGFPVPMTQAESLPEGQYQLRLSRPGELSETWPLEVKRGEVNTHAVGLANRWLWPPIDLRPGEVPEVHRVQFKDGMDFIIARHNASDGNNTYTSVQRIDGATGEAVWAGDFKLDEQTLPAGASLPEWRGLLHPAFGSATLPGGRRISRIVDESTDLNDDGARDLVFVSHTSPSLLAVSGSDGRVLWWHRSNAPVPEEIRQLPGSDSGASISLPAMYDVNNDNTPDFLCVFATSRMPVRSVDDDRLSLKRFGWITAVSGSTGDVLWSFALPPDSVEQAHDSETLCRQQLVCRPTMSEIDGRVVVHMLPADGKKLLTIDAVTGDLIWEHGNLQSLHSNAAGLVPLLAPRVVSANNAGRGLLLVFRGMGRQNIRMGYWDFDTAAFRWSKSVNLTSRVEDLLQHRGSEWLLIESSADGKSDLIITPCAHAPSSSSVRWSGVQAIDAATGESQWRNRLAVTGIEDVPPPIERFLLGPDLDDDGVQDLFVAWKMSQANRTTSHYVAAISSQDGRVLWRFQQPSANGGTSPDRSSTIQIWRPGNDGWAQLLVSVVDGPGNHSVTFVLSSATGRLEQTIFDVNQLDVADLDGDGISDIFYEQPQETRHRLVALRGQPPAVWSQLGQWQPINDLDDDDHHDLLQLGEDRLVVRAGGDGRVLWQNPKGVRDPYGFDAPAPPVADLNADTVPDLFVFDTGTGDSRLGRQSFRTVSAVSGRDGTVLWTSGDFGMTSTRTSGAMGGRPYQYPTILSHDLTGDGRAEALVPHRGARGGQQSSLAVLDGGTGELLWEHPFVDGTFGADGMPLDSFLADLDGDGAKDVLLWSVGSVTGSSDANYALAAVSGRTGQVLWRAPVKVDQGYYIPLEPLAADLDQDGSLEVAYAYRQQWNGEFYPVELRVVDGRTGGDRATWSWRAAGSGMAPLTAPRLGPEGNRMLCAPINFKDDEGRIHQQAVFLELLTNQADRDRGQLIEHDRFDIDPEAAIDARGFIWRAVTIDASGREALLYRDAGHLKLRDASRVVWQWLLPDSATELIEIREAPDHRSQQVAIWSGNSVYGLAAQTGQPTWRCDVPLSPLVGSASSLPQVSLVPHPGDDQRPDVFFAYSDHVSYRWRSKLLRAWPCRADGTYLPPAKSELDLQSIAEFTLPLRVLPWVPTRPENGIPAWLVWPYFIGGLGSLWVLVLPLWVVVWIIRRRLWLLGCLPSLIAVAGWLVPPRQGVASLIAMILPLWLLFVALRETRYQLWGLAIGYALLTLLPLAGLIPDSSLAEFHRWGQWWWVEEMVCTPLVIASTTMPGVVFWVALVGCFTRRDWKTSVFLITSSLLFAGVFAIVTISHDRAFSSLEQGYSLRGWWQIWFAGVFATGCLVLLVWLGRRGWRRIRKTAPQHVALAT